MQSNCESTNSGSTTALFAVAQTWPWLKEADLD